MLLGESTFGIKHPDAIKKTSLCDLFPTTYLIVMVIIMMVPIQSTTVIGDTLATES